MEHLFEVRVKLREAQRSAAYLVSVCDESNDAAKARQIAEESCISDCEQRFQNAIELPYSPTRNKDGNPVLIGKTKLWFLWLVIENQAVTWM